MNIEIFSIPDCKYCEMAKESSAMKIIKSATYTELTREEFKARGYESAPAIYLDGVFLGGYTQLTLEIARRSALLLEFLYLHGLKEWDGYLPAEEVFKEWLAAENLPDDVSL